MYLSRRHAHGLAAPGMCARPTYIRLQQKKAYAVLAPGMRMSSLYLGACATCRKTLSPHHPRI